MRNFRGVLIEEFQRRGHIVHVGAPEISSDSDTREWLEQRNVKWHDVPLDRTGINPIKDLLTFMNLLHILVKVRPDAFLGYTIKPVIWGLMAASITRTPIRTVIITGLGYTFIESDNIKRSFVKKSVYKLYKLALRRATLIYFQNRDDREDLKKIGLLPTNVKNKVVNGSGVDLDHFQRQPLKADAMRFLMIGRLLGDKGVREYAAAADILVKKWPHAEFHLVGGYDENPNSISEKEIQEWVKSGRIKWHGHVSDIRKPLADCSVFVLPSYREGTPRSTLEALAVGRPVVTTDAPGCRETVIDGKNGYLVPVRDPTALAIAMERFLTNPKLIHKMALESHKMALEKFDVHKVNNSILEEIG